MRCSASRMTASRDVASRGLTESISAAMLPFTITPTPEERRSGKLSPATLTAAW